MPVDIIIILLILLIIILIVMLFWCGRRQAPVQPQGWLLEAWGRGDRIEDHCGDNQVETELYKNLTQQNMTVNIEVRNDNEGNCTVELSTTANPNFLTVISGVRKACVLPLNAGDKITYLCKPDASGTNCWFHVRIQKL